MRLCVFYVLCVCMLVVVMQLASAVVLHHGVQSMWVMEIYMKMSPHLILYIPEWELVVVNYTYY